MSDHAPNGARAVRLSTSTNADEVVRSLDAFGHAILGRAASRAVNKLADQAKTAGLREVSAIYGIGPRSFERYVTVKLAAAGEFQASIRAKGQGLPLYLFDARQTAKGVSVRIKGRRFVVPHAFIATMRSGRVGVFARGAYGGQGITKPTGERFGRFVFGSSYRGRNRARLPINELYTFSPPDAFANPRVVQAMSDRVQDQLDKVMRREIAFALRSGR